jgi:hypothetical protein
VDIFFGTVRTLNDWETHVPGAFGPGLPAPGADFSRPRPFLAQPLPEGPVRLGIARRDLAFTHGSFQ